MKRFIIGIIVGALLSGTASAIEKAYNLEMFSAAVTDEEVIACINTGGEGVILYDLELDGAGSYTATSTGNACVKEVR